MDMYAKEKSYEEYRLTGVHRILLDIPDKTEEVKMVRFAWLLDVYQDPILYIFFQLF